MPAPGERKRCRWRFRVFASAFKTVKPFACKAGTSHARLRNNSAAMFSTPISRTSSMAAIKPDQAEQVVRAGFVFRRAVAKNNLFLCDEIRATHVMPAVNRRVHFFLQLAPDVKQARATGAEQPFVRVGGEKIHVLDRRRKRAEGLNRIEAEQNAAFAQKFADGLVVQR